MVTVETRLRRGKVLTPSAIPCLQRLPTINITLGCAHGCGYCYIQGYANYPGVDRVVLFVNTLEALREELARARTKPRRVFFSPSSDPFQYEPEVREVTLRSMRTLLEAGVEVAFLTKGFVTSECFELFRDYPKQVIAQFGVTTTNQSVSRAIEPRAAPPRMRIDAIQKLTRMGVSCTARLDPLFPDVTDTEPNLSELMPQLSAAGIVRGSASFLFIRGAFRAKVKSAYAELGGGFGAFRWAAQTFSENCGPAEMLDRDSRAERMSRVIAIGARFGVNISACTCKNPDFPGPGCAIAGNTLEPWQSDPGLFGPEQLSGRLPDGPGRI